MPEIAILTEALARRIWQEALANEIGVRVPVESENQNRVRAFLYQIRQQMDMPELEQIQISISPDTKEFWLIKKSTPGLP